MITSGTVSNSYISLTEMWTITAQAYLELPTWTNHLTYCNFVQCMLYFNCYWLVILYF